MSSSLEGLLVEEGFKGRRRKVGRPRASSGSQAVGVPLNPFQEKNQLGSAYGGVRVRTERNKSDVARYSSRNELPGNERVRVRRARVGSHRIVGNSKKDLKETARFEERDSNGVRETERIKARSLKDFPQNEIVEDRRRSDSQENERFQYSNEAQKSQRRKDRNSCCVREKEKERYKGRSRKDVQQDKRHNNSSNKNLPGRTNFSDNSRKIVHEAETSYRKPTIRSQSNKILEDKGSQKHLDIEQTVSELAIDKVAIKAMISILNRYIRCFLKDKNFRTSLHHNCSSCLGFTELEEGHHAENKVIADLEQAIGTVERVAEELANAKELKKASIQLSMITGLNSNDFKDGFTSGVPNSHLSACAHLYLSVIYKLQKKDRITAKHLLQVFCDSPFLARTRLLPELWECLFLPHLSHLTVWYNQEADSMPDTPNRLRKVVLLQNYYNAILDTGTYQFAAYYKDWLTEGVEAPSIPLIHIPSMSVQRISKGGSHGHSPEQGSSPTDSVSPESLLRMMSKKLYEAVFGQSNKLDVLDEVGDSEEVKIDMGVRNFDVSIEEDKQSVTYSTEQGKYIAQHNEEAPYKITGGNTSIYAEGLLMTVGEVERLNRVSASGVGELGDELAKSSLWCATPGNTDMLHLLRHTKSNELTLNKLAKSVFQLQQNKDSVDLSAVTPSHSTDMPMPHSFTNVSNTRYCVDGLDGIYEYFDEGSFLSSIPKHFICPLTGHTFEDPVTLETGQTFERVAIKEWFDQGKQTCPITGRKLECAAVPVSNFVLKRVIDNWKSEYCKNLLACAFQIAGNSVEHGYKSKDETALFIIEHLLTGFNEEERMANAKYLISLGGLQFLIKRFELGNLEEKTRIVALLSCCIEANGNCRNYLARNIKKPCILELLHSNQVKSTAKVVVLLTELICLNRRTEITSFLRGLQIEGIMNTMHVFLAYLQSSPAEQRPLVAVLLLHFDLLLEHRNYSIYRELREEAVDAITVALDYCLTDEKVRAQSCRALLILGGHFSFSGEVLTEDWLLRLAGFYDDYEANSLASDAEDLQIDETVPWEEEEKAREDWFKKLAASLLGNGKQSFLETISKCLGTGNSDLVRVCLVTVAWLSRALVSQSDVEFQLTAFSALIPWLKKILVSSERVENRVLASMSLLNFSKISECNVLLTTIAEEIAVSLRTLAEVTWTAKQLHKFISREDLRIK